MSVRSRQSGAPRAVESNATTIVLHPRRISPVLSAGYEWTAAGGRGDSASRGGATGCSGSSGTTAFRLRPRPACASVLLHSTRALVTPHQSDCSRQRARCRVAWRGENRLAGRLKQRKKRVTETQSATVLSLRRTLLTGGSCESSVGCCTVVLWRCSWKLHGAAPLLNQSASVCSAVCRFSFSIRTTLTRRARVRHRCQRRAHSSSFTYSPSFDPRPPSARGLPQPQPQSPLQPRVAVSAMEQSKKMTKEERIAMRAARVQAKRNKEGR